MFCGFNQTYCLKAAAEKTNVCVFSNKLENKSHAFTFRFDQFDLPQSEIVLAFNQTQYEISAPSIQA